MKKTHWILRSNRYFDTWGDFKLLALFVMIILSGVLDHFVFETNMIGYAITLIPFMIWRMLGLYLPRECEHTKNYRMHKYVLEDGTPMIDFQCYDCDHSDKGHVYGDGENWEEIKVVKDNKIIIHSIKRMDDQKIKEEYPKAWEEYLDHSGLRKSWHPFDDPKWYRQLFDFFDENEIAVEIGVDLTLEAKYCYRTSYLKDGEWINSGIGVWSDLYYTRAEAEQYAFLAAFIVLERKLDERIP